MFNVRRSGKDVCVETTGKVRSNKDVYEVANGFANENGWFTKFT